MILEYLDDRGRPARVVASRVVIRETVTNTPVAVAADFAERGILAATAADDDFQQMLQVTGVTNTVLVTHLTRDDIIVPGIH